MIGVYGSPLPVSSTSGCFFRRVRRYLVVSCEITKQGERFLSSIATAEDPFTSTGLLRKFVASSSKHVALNTLHHIISHPRLCSIAFPLYSIIRKESWFSWNAKLVADLIASLYSQKRFFEAENFVSETVLKLRFNERDLCKFYCDLVNSHARQKSKKGVLDSFALLNQLMLDSSSVYVKQKGYESMIGGFSEIGLPDRGENLMEEMSKMGLKPSIFVLRSLVYGYGRIGFLEDMKRIIVQMEKEGFELDTVCCNMVISSFGAHNELLDMVSWLKKMRGLRIPLSIRTYNSALNSCPNIILLLQDLKNVPLSIQELVDNLNKDEADLVLELAKSSVLDQVMEWNCAELKMDLHGMHLSSAYLILLQWLDLVKMRFVAGSNEIPAEILVVCGSGKHSSTRGESPVKGLVKEMMMRMKCPLRIDRKNIGCFIGKGKNVKNWVCLEDAHKIPAESAQCKN